MAQQSPRPTSALARLGEWFAARADGEWEHRHSISVQTLDNPGWVFSADLSDTPLHELAFEEKRVDRTDQDWYHCRVEGSTFRGYCGVGNLEEVLDIFLDWGSIGGHQS